MTHLGPDETRTYTHSIAEVATALAIHHGSTVFLMWDNLSHDVLPLEGWDIAQAVTAYDPFADTDAQRWYLFITGVR